MLNRNDAKKITTVLSLPLSTGGGDNFHPQIWKRRDQKKSECLGGVKESLLYVSCQKRLCKMEYGFEGEIVKCQSWSVLAKQPSNV